MPVKSAQFDVVRWRPWPCEECRGGASVLDFLVGCHQADGAFPRGSADEIIDAMTARERVWLPQWARDCPHQKENSWNLAKLNEGSEHFVYLTENGENVLKLTKPGIFGDYYFLKDGRVNQRCCTPGDYLSRMYLLNRHFGFAPESADARDENFVKTTHGIVPIDLRMWWVKAD